MVLVGFIWMIVAAIVGGHFMQVVIAFCITVMGPIFWWIGYKEYKENANGIFLLKSRRYAAKREKQMHLEH